MPLARIITRSHQCSRELALDLLARGYTVEVVSPDNIPDNIADLELRVEAGPGDQLVASVEAHHGERSTSLDFVHYLKAPMADFVRRPPEPQNRSGLEDLPTNLNAEFDGEDFEIPAEASQSASEAADPNTNLPRAPALEAEPVQEFPVEETVRLISPAEREPLLSMERPTERLSDSVAIHSANTDPANADSANTDSDSLRPTIVPPRHEARKGAADTKRQWRPMLTVASAVLLALAVRFGISQAEKSGAGKTGAPPTVNVAAASTEVDLLSSSNSEKRDESKLVATSGNSPGKNPESASVPAAPSQTIKSQTNLASSPINVPAARPEALATAAIPVNRVADRRGDGLIAHDTVTYLDKNLDKSGAKTKRTKMSATKTSRTKNSATKTSGTKTSAKKSAQNIAHRHPAPARHHSTGVAADTVTYLDKTPIPKVSKQN